MTLTFFDFCRDTPEPTEVSKDQKTDEPYQNYSPPSENSIMRFDVASLLEHGLKHILTEEGRKLLFETQKKYEATCFENKKVRQPQCSQCGAIGELVAAFALAPVCDKCAELLEHVTTDHAIFLHTIFLFSEEERHHILRCAHERARDWNTAHAREHVPSRQRLHANAVYGIPRFPKLTDEE